MKNELKCRDCVSPNRYPGCHATCKEYLEWKEEKDKEKEKARKKKYLQTIGKY